jgi:predicted transcriptional regulator
MSQLLPEEKSVNSLLVKQVPKKGFRNRSRIDILANLLSAARGGSLKTHLMYKANLSFVLATQYLSLLCESGLICEVLDEEMESKRYQTTEKGLKFLDIYESLQGMVPTE